jgi:hypothetical protein
LLQVSRVRKAHARGVARETRVAANIEPATDTGQA